MNATMNAMNAMNTMNAVGSMSLLDAMNDANRVHNVVATAVTLGLVGAVLLVSAGAKRFLAVPTEWSRKAVHIGVGLTAAFAPTLFTTPLLPMACGGLLVLLFVVTRKLGILSAVHGVRRATSGVIAFPLAGVALMAVTGAHGALYVLPLLIVSLADAAAALVGRPFGKHRFRVGEAVRSVEGTLAFVTVAFAVALVVLAVNGLPLWAVLLTSSLVAAATALAEALTQRGWDNAVIPLVAYAVLLTALAPTMQHVVVSAALLAGAAALCLLSGVARPTPAAVAALDAR